MIAAGGRQLPWSWSAAPDVQMLFRYRHGRWAMEGSQPRRRDVLAGIAASVFYNPLASAAPLVLDPRSDIFRFVRSRALELASKPFSPPPERLSPTMAAMGYDEYRDLQFKPEQAVWRGERLGFELQFFAAAYIYRSPVEIYVVDQGSLLAVVPTRGMFNFGLQETRIPSDAPLSFSGFRINAPLNAASRHDEVVVFQGASYFRGLARGHTYGLSARGLAINAGAPVEEFPLFRAFWIERPSDASRITVHALLDSTSVTGAYTFHIRPGLPTAMDVRAELFPRHDVVEVGLAPLTSMFFKGAHDTNGPPDFRPAVHDSEGLAVWNMAGQRIWRPLVNPGQSQSTAFVEEGLKGFGLIQRDRTFDAYQDLEAKYHTRPSAWVEPSGDWGAGATRLVELPTDAEYFDNIGAFWRPTAGLRAGTPFAFAYTLSWLNDTPAQRGFRVSKTRVGSMPGNDHVRFVVDFVRDDPSSNVETITEPYDAPTALVRASHGVCGAPHIQGNPYTGGIRVTLEFDPQESARSDVSIDLADEEGVSSEQWRYRWIRE